jgi:crotonobetainyl-CoA:carnitine CoA-transferase CaiB-like acyl-CoA transferase
MTGRLPEPTGNSHPAWAPHGVYRCADQDQWVALAVRSDAEFTALCSVIGRPELATDPRFADGLSRHRNRAELDAPITAWTSERSPLAAAEALQAAGVPAGPVESFRQLVDEDPQLQARGFMEEVTHVDAGTWRMERPVWRFSDAPAHIRINAPGFGEHNEAVFAALLGLGQPELDNLTADGVIGDVPDLAAHGR